MPQCSCTRSNAGRGRGSPARKRSPSAWDIFPETRSAGAPPPWRKANMADTCSRSRRGIEGGGQRLVIIKVTAALRFNRGYLPEIDQLRYRGARGRGYRIGSRDIRKNGLLLMIFRKALCCVGWRVFPLGRNDAVLRSGSRSASV